MPNTQLAVFADTHIPRKEVLVEGASHALDVHLTEVLENHQQQSQGRSAPCSPVAWTWFF